MSTNEVIHCFKYFLKTFHKTGFQRNVNFDLCNHLTKLVFFSNFSCLISIEAVPTFSFSLSTSLSEMTEKAYINAFYFSAPQKMGKLKKGQSSFWFLEKSILKRIKK